MLVNLWKSEYTNQVTYAPTDWFPKFDGWTLVETRYFSTAEEAFNYCRTF